MDHRISEFSSLLADLVEQAQISGNVLYAGEIQDFFSELSLGEQDFKHIYAYLKASHIEIKDSVLSEDVEKEVLAYKEAAKERLEKFFNESDFSGEGEERRRSKFIDLYRSDLKKIPKMKKEEEGELLSRILSGDEAAREEYVERKLHYVLQAAEDFSLSGEYFEELIEEGNIALLLAVEDLMEGREEKNPVSFIEEVILDSMQAFIDETLELEKSLGIMVSKVNFVSDAANKLKEEKGRIPTLMELAAYTNLTEEELTEIISLSKDNLIEN